MTSGKIQVKTIEFSFKIRFINGMVHYFKKYVYEIVLVVLIIAYSILFSYLSIQRDNSFHSYYYDLGIMNQVVYNTAHGHFLEMTNPDLGVNLSRFAIHFDPILAFFAPFYWFHNGPEVLLIGQSIILALGALAVYAIAHTILKNKLFSLLFALLYLVYYPMQQSNLFDVHGVTFATTFLLFTFYFILKKHYGPAFMFIGLSLLTKENVALITFFLGAYLFFIQKERKLGALLSLFSVVFFILIVFVVIPHARHGQHFALKYFSFSLPHIFHMIWRKESLQYIGTVLQPVAFLPIFSPVTLLISSSDFMINLLSSNGNLRSTYFQYTALITPFIFISTIYGFKNVKRLFLKEIPLITPWLLTGIVIYAIFVNYKLGPWRYMHYTSDKQKLSAVQMWQLRLADPALKVSTTGQLAPFFTSRRYFYDFLFDPSYGQMGLTDDDIISKRYFYQNADYIIIAKSEIPDKEGRLERKFYNQLIQNTQFNKIYDANQIEVYKKI